jgi:hypothetical protein
VGKVVRSTLSDANARRRVWPASDIDDITDGAQLDT